jgi:uncharacterized protein YmfQ (DUF2313 family)
MYTTDQIVKFFRNLLPTGKVWNTYNTNMAAFLNLLAPGFQRLQQQADKLEVETPAGELFENLPDWEATVGLPNSCSSLAQTIQQRRQSVNNQLVGPTGVTPLSNDFYINYFAALGVTVQIIEYASFRTDIGQIGQPLYGDDYWFTFAVNVINNNPIYFQTDISYPGEPLVSYANVDVACIMNKISPAHCRVIILNNGI